MKEVLRTAFFITSAYFVQMHKFQTLFCAFWFAFLWFWNTEGGPWTRTVSSGVAQFDNYKVVSSGTYRVKSVFTVTTKDGKSETITMYSNEVKVA